MKTTKPVQLITGLIILMFLVLPSSASSQDDTSYARFGMKTKLEIEWTADNYGTIQWQRSTDNGVVWTDLIGANAPSYEFTATGDALFRTKIMAQEICEPIYITRAVKTVNFTVDVSTVSPNSIEYELTNVDLKDAQIVEYGFAYNWADLSTRGYSDMQRYKIGTQLPEGSAFGLQCKGLDPGKSYAARVYFLTSDGSMIFGPNKIARTLPGIKWTSEDWVIQKNALEVRFELADFSSILGSPNLTFKFGETRETLQNAQFIDLGNYKYRSTLISGLQPNATYWAQVELDIDGEKQTILRTVKTLPDYSNVVVDETTTPVKNTIRWDATKTLHRISPVGMQTEYPRIIRVNADTLLCSYHGGTGNDFWVNIYLQKSFDNGRTWTAPTLLMDKEKSTIGTRYWRFCNPEMIKLQNGWIVMSFVGNGNPETNNNCHVMVMISKDNGETWGDPIIVGRGRTWEPMIVQLPNGELELFVSSEAAWFQNTSPMPQEILFSRSTDNGMTWTAFKRASYSPNRRDGMPAAVVLQGNKGILFSIEIVNDGGWGSPSMVRRSLKDEWDETPWNNADTDKRWHVNLNAHGGGPYTLQLPTGEIVVMAHVNGQNVWQTSYPRVTVGDNNGKNFTTAVTPITNLPSNEGAYYNSLFLKDDETVWLVVTHSLYDGTTRKKGEIKYMEGKIVEKKY